METADAITVTPQGSTAYIGTPLTSWEERYGPAGGTQMGYAIPYEEFGSISVNRSQDGIVVDLEKSFDTPVSIPTALSLINPSLPPDSLLIQTHWGSPTPSGPIGTRTQIWESAQTGISIALMVYITGDESTGTVSRIMMGSAR